MYTTILLLLLQKHTLVLQNIFILIIKCQCRFGKYIGHTSGQTGKTKVQADHSFQKIQEKQIELYNVNS